MPSVEMLCLQTRLFAIISYFRENVTFLSVGLLKIGQVFLSAVKLCVGGLRQIAVLRAMCQYYLTLQFESLVQVP
jgi:hypothetical protein